jgi:tyrosine-protein kinase Etk/Wzc
MSLATIPTTPLNNSVSQVSGVGIFLGLVLGIIFAIMREMFDTSIGTIKDVERTLKLSVLAVIPHINPIKLEQNKKENGQETEKDMSVHGSDSILATHFNPKVPVAEAYRILRTNIDYILYNKSIKTILFTSSAMQEGKSTTISNLGVVFAQQGKKVLIVELNLRRPSLHKVMGYDRGPGITDILIGKTKWQNCIKNVIDLALGKFTIDDVLATPGLDNLYILPYGHKPPNPTELISSNKMDELLKEFKDNFDLILVDGPPLLPVADSMIISKKVDGVILVYMVGKTPRNSLRLTKDRLETVKANVLGLVLNGIRPETGGTEYASYSMYAYTADKDKDTSGKKSLLSKSRLFFKKS